METKEPATRTPNRLIKEGSPYLREHAYNPVSWYPWGDEAFSKARNDGKPIFLSVGYSTCHWCHVLARESFENKETAAFMNKNFISIKVDREERPEVDAYYMGAIQSMTGGGGWPLSVFLTPDLKPFYGGTYFPGEPKYGMPSFRQVLEFVADLWKKKRGDVLDSSSQIAAAIARGADTGGDAPKAAQLDEGYSAMVSGFDPEHGGFGGAPKFPLPLTLQFLLRFYKRSGKEMALKAVVRTLDAMSAGGIRDHVGGGFHRYSTDRVWLIPHFEKMLYDNALLARTYTEAFQATHEPRYERVARETLGWMISEMRDERGGFYSAQDADTIEGEGNYYSWTPDELEGVLGKKEAERFAELYGVTKTGNFEGRSILHLTDIQSGRSDESDVVTSLGKLYKARLARPRPAVDNKVLTSWNGLAISALAFAGSVFDSEDYVSAARGASKFVRSTCTKEGGLLRRYADGEAALEGTLEDYAFFAQGLIDLFEATGEPDDLEEALRLTKELDRRFSDSSGGLYMIQEDSPMRMKEGYDGPTPSGNSVAALGMVRLAELTGDLSLRERGAKILTAFGGTIDGQPTGHANMLIAADLLVNGVSEVVIAARSEKELKPFVRAVRKGFHPDAVLLPVTRSTVSSLKRTTTLLDGREPGEKGRAFVCRNFTCKLPAGSPEALASQLAQ